MFGMGMPEIILILAIALIVIGPKKLPDLAKSLGRALGEFKHATKEFKSAIDIDADVKSIGKPFDDLSEQVKKNFSSKSDKEEDDKSSDKKTEEAKAGLNGDGNKAGEEADAVFTRNSTEDYPEAAEADAPEASASSPSGETTAAKEDAKA